MDDEARATGLDPVPDREPTRAPAGPAVALSASAQRSRQAARAGWTCPVRPMPRSISAPTTAGCWWRAPTRDGFRVVDAFSRIIRLGEGITSSGRLSEAAIVRAVEALRVCRAKMRNRGVTRARLIATEACRAAGNGLDFLERVRERGRHRARDRRPRDRGAARRHRLHAAGRSAGRGRHPVRHRRRLVRAGAARALRCRRGTARRIRRSRAGPRCRSAW